MDGQEGQGASKRPKLLACKRCRHRKQKCTEVRPCENCTQSGSECIPSESAVSKPPLEPHYVQRLEERVAQLEALLPQESLDHLNAAQPQDHHISPPRVDHQSTPAATLAYQTFANRIESPAQYDATSFAASAPLSFSSPDSLTADVLGALTGIQSQSRGTSQDGFLPEPPDLGMELEQFLIMTYFDMAHCQYPFLPKYDFLQWVEAWRARREPLTATLRWKGFFVNMVYAIAFLMTKTRIDGTARSQSLYKLATSRYLPDLVALPDAVTRAQGFLLLTIYSLHMPSQENIVSLSSWTIRFCIMSQLHLKDTQPDPSTNDALIQTQLRRRAFWCAYAIDRAVCSTYDFPYSVSDGHITVPVFDDIEDDQLPNPASYAQPRGQSTAAIKPTNVTSALHMFSSRQLESEIQETMLRKDFIPHSDEAFIWRGKMMEKVQQWNRQSRNSLEPSQKGYVSLRWLKMIYYYNIVMLYRPTRAIVQGIAGDWSAQACCQALLLFRKFQMAREIAQPWLGLLTQFQIGVTLLYCFYATPISQWKPSYRSADVPDAIRACSSTLAILAERWAEAECVRDVFEVLAREIPLSETWGRPERMREAGKKGIEKNWKRMSEIVVHRPTLRMIHEMATEDFPNHIEVDSASANDAAAGHGATTITLDGMDLEWMDPAHGSSFDVTSQFGTASGMDAYSDVYFNYG